MSSEEFQEVDDILRLLGNPGRFQVIQFLVLAYQYIPLAMNDFILIFYGLLPTSVRCKGEVTNTTSNFSVGENRPGELPNRTTMAPPVCHCPDGFTYEYPDRQWSIIGDMDLICDKAALVQLSSVIYFFGQMLSTPVFGWSADKFGRRPVLLLSNCLYTVLTVALVFSRDYVSFVLLRFFVGVARQGMNSSFFVLMMEWTPPNRRGTWAALAELSYTFGVLIITLAAFLLQNWIHIQAFLGALTILSIPLYWFAPESMTWLCLHGRAEQAVVNCKKIAKFNNISLTDTTYGKIRRFAERMTGKDASSGYSFADCFRTPNVRRTTLLCCFTWLSCYFGYLGLSYLSSEIATDVYLNLAINGILEFVPIVFAYGIASRFGNRVPLVVYFLVGGICSLAAGTIPGDSSAEAITRTVLAFIGRMSFVGTCCVIFVFTSELFPTVIRNNGFSLCSIALRIGCVVSPLLPLMATKSAYKGSGFVLVGIMAILSAGTSFMLRETKGKALPDTIEDAEKLGSPMPIHGPIRLRKYWSRKRGIKSSNSIHETAVDANVPIPTVVRVD